MNDEAGAAREVFICAGETSGETHAANLIREIRDRNRSVRFSGMGGELMEAAGCHLLFNLVDMAVLGVRAVIRELPRFLRVIALFYRYLETRRPDLVVLVDYPGLNFKLARIARSRGIPVIYYICPQLWAWGLWRTRRFRRLVDKALVILPFEKPFFEHYGLPAEYVGHPLIDHIETYPFDPAFLAELERQSRPLVGLLPGSRGQEIRSNLPAMVDVAKRLRERHPAASFVIPTPRERLTQRIRETLAESGLDALVATGRAHEVMKTVDLALVASGTAVLELAYLVKPMVVYYRLTPLETLLRNVLLSVPYVASINLIAGREVVPEFCTHRDVSRAMTWSCLDLLDNGPGRKRMIEDLTALRERYGAPRATERAAKAILQALGLWGERPRPQAPGPRPQARGSRP